jgi:hypothetical protein
MDAKTERTRRQCAVSTHGYMATIFVRFKQMKQSAACMLCFVLRHFINLMKQLTSCSFFDYEWQKTLSLKPAVIIRTSYKRVGLLKQRKSFQGLAMYAHKVLVSLQTRAILSIFQNRLLNGSTKFH